MIAFELLTTENFKLNSLDYYQRRQDVKKVYRKQNGEYTLVDCVYIEDWDMPKRRAVAKDISGQKEARMAEAEALYISACSSEETIAFYKAMRQKLQIVR